MRTALLLLIFFCTSCGPDLPEEKALIDLYYQSKVDLLLKDKDQTCRKKASDQAIIEIDSLIDRWINTDLLDSLIFPDKPVKPRSPDHIIDKVQKFEVEELKDQ